MGAGSLPWLQPFSLTGFFYLGGVASAGAHDMVDKLEEGSQSQGRTYICFLHVLVGLNVCH